jgi:thymidylate synthase
MSKENLNNFGLHIHGNTIGEVWLNLNKAILEKGENLPDEKRRRLAVQNVIIKSESQIFPDEIINKYANRDFLHQLIEMHLSQDEMHDFDIVPSFSDGPKSYYKRIKEGKMIEYIVNRLSEIPESKKAIMIFPTWQDYQNVLDNPYDDYLPCTVSIQFRMIEKENNWDMHTIWYARSLDAYQKSHGNMSAIVLIGRKIKEELNKKLDKKVELASLTGFITDAHIYNECKDEVTEIIKKI